MDVSEIQYLFYSVYFICVNNQHTVYLYAHYLLICIDLPFEQMLPKTCLQI